MCGNRPSAGDPEKGLVRADHELHTEVLLEAQCLLCCALGDLVPRRKVNPGLKLSRRVRSGIVRVGIHQHHALPGTECLAYRSVLAASPTVTRMPAVHGHGRDHGCRAGAGTCPREGSNRSMASSRSISEPLPVSINATPAALPAEQDMTQAVAAVRQN